MCASRPQKLGKKAQKELDDEAVRKRLAETALLHQQQHEEEQKKLKLLVAEQLRQKRGEEQGEAAERRCKRPKLHAPEKPEKPKKLEAFRSPQHRWAHPAPLHVTPLPPPKPIDRAAALEALQTRRPWPSCSEAVWQEMTLRMIALPFENHHFWDNAEEDTLLAYLSRFIQDSVLAVAYPPYKMNWTNASNALKHYTKELASKYMVSGTCCTGLKQAIRHGCAVDLPEEEDFGLRELKNLSIEALVQHISPLLRARANLKKLISDE